MVPERPFQENQLVDPTAAFPTGCTLLATRSLARLPASIHLQHRIRVLSLFDWQLDLGCRTPRCSVSSACAMMKRWKVADWCLIDKFAYPLKRPYQYAAIVRVAVFQPRTLCWLIDFLLFTKEERTRFSFANSVSTVQVNFSFFFSGPHPIKVLSSLAIWCCQFKTARAKKEKEKLCFTSSATHARAHHTRAVVQPTIIQIKSCITSKEQ